MARSRSDRPAPTGPPGAPVDGLQKLAGNEPITTAGIDAYAALIEEHPELGSPEDIAVMRSVLEVRERLEEVASGYFEIIPGFINFSGGPRTVTIIGRWDGSDVTVETFGVLATLFPNLTVNSARLDPEGVFRWTVTLPEPEPAPAEAEDAAQ